jgi:hypothetical protein
MTNDQPPKLFIEIGPVRSVLSESLGLTLHFNCRPVRSRLRLVAILFGGPFRSAGAGWIGRGSGRPRMVSLCVLLSHSVP